MLYVENPHDQIFDTQHVFCSQMMYYGIDHSGSTNPRFGRSIQRYDDETKMKIGRYAAQYGLGEAMRMFKDYDGRMLPKTTVHRFKNLYLTRIDHIGK